VQLRIEVRVSVGAKIKINDEHRQVELGKMDQEYITDRDLLRILADTELDRNLMKELEGCKLRLITKVIYSERLEVKAEREREVFYIISRYNKGSLR